MAMTPKQRRKQRQHQSDIARLQDPKYDEETYREKMYDPKGWRDLTLEDYKNWRAGNRAKIKDFLKGEKGQKLLFGTAGASLGAALRAKRKTPQKKSRRVPNAGRLEGYVSKGSQWPLKANKFNRKGGGKIMYGYKKGGQV